MSSSYDRQESGCIRSSVQMIVLLWCPVAGGHRSDVKFVPAPAHIRQMGGDRGLKMLFGVRPIGINVVDVRREELSLSDDSRVSHQDDEYVWMLCGDNGVGC